MEERADLQKGQGLISHGGQPEVWLVGDVSECSEAHVVPHHRQSVEYLQHRRTDEADDGVVI